MMSEDELRAFVQRHKLCWEVQPLKEMVKDVGVRRTGLEFHLFARWRPVPPESLPRDWFERIHAGAVEVVEHVMPRAAPGVHVEIEAPHAMMHLRPESEWVPELELTVLATPTQSGEPPGPKVVEALLREVERHLGELGVHTKSWRQQP